MPNLVQIGCNIGQDDVQKFLEETDISYDVLLIDANLKSLLQCENSYKALGNKHHIVFLNVAIVSDPTISSIDIYVPNNDETSVFSSSSEKHTKLHSLSSCFKTDVPACTLNKLFERFNLSEIEYLYIDTEGLCVDNLLALNFSKVSIDKIIFEFIHSDGMLSYGGPKLDKLKKLLKEQGYSLTESGYNIDCKKE